MANAKFSLNLNSSGNNIFSALNKSSETLDNNVFGINNVITEAASTIFDTGLLTGANVSLPIGQKDGIFINDKQSQQCVLKFTAFQAFPVSCESFTTMCLDGVANKDTQIGGITSGLRSFPGSFDENALNAITEKQFKIGCAVSYNQGMQYLKYFYPDTQWDDGDFRKLVNGMFLTAEVTVPLSSTEGKIIYIKVVDLSPDGVIDIMGSYCALDCFKDIFKIDGFTNSDYSDKGRKWAEVNPKFIFSDKSYNHITGEIDGYGPDSVKSYRPKDNTVASLFKTYTVGTPASDQFFVRFFVHPSLRADAEKKLAHPLPDDFCKSKYGESPSGDTITGGTTSINMNYEIAGDLSAEAKEILSKPIQFTAANYPYKIMPQSQVKSGKTVWGRKTYIDKPIS